MLAYRVTVYRRRFGVGIGSGSAAGEQENKQVLSRAIRAHANAVEYLPIAILLLALAELTGMTALWLHGLGIVLLVSRVLHAWGLSHSSGKSLGRFWGTLLCWTAILVLAAFNAIQYLTNL